MVFTHDDVVYNITIIKKNNKHLYIRVNDKLEIIITCPYLYTNRMINEIIDENKNDIISMIEKQKAKNELKKRDDYGLLGEPLCVLYSDVSRPKTIGNKVMVKDHAMLDRWYKKKALDIFKIYLDEAYEVFEENIPYPKLKVRSMKTRWGVCNRRDNSITLNLELIKKDQEYLNYVIVHELSHFVYFDHSRDFWRIVEKYCPDYKRVRKALKE